MSLNDDDLRHVCKLAGLDFDPARNRLLLDDINAIMDFVDQLREADTGAVAPLFHPFDLHQRLRPDEASEESCLAELEAIAPLFEEGHYLVPKVIDDA